MAPSGNFQDMLDVAGRHPIDLRDLGYRHSVLEPSSDAVEMRSGDFLAGFRETGITGVLVGSSRLGGACTALRMRGLRAV
jgi:hypothetical protein